MSASVVRHQMGQREGTFLIPPLSQHQQITFCDLTKPVFTLFFHKLCFRHKLDPLKVTCWLKN